jgi:acetolactate synthase-1/2/3 large subunit
MYAGVLFHALSDYLEELYENRDLVIGLGYDPVEYNYESWIPGVPLIHFGTRPTDLPLREKMFQYSGEPDEWFKMLDHFNAGLLAPVRGQIAGIRDEIISVINGFTNHFGPVSALSVLREELPDGSIVTADVGSHLHLIGQMWDPGITGELIMTNGWSGMGFGIPAALAASIQRPGSTVVCVTGDGGFLMMAGEVVTAKRNNLPVIIVVLSDGELNLIKLKQSWKEIPSYGTRLYHDDLFGSDTFLGVKVLRADSDDTMRNSVRLALTMNQPVILNAVIDPEDYRWLVVKKQV